MSGDAVSPRGYPRPLLRRARWASLDGEWDFAGDPERQWLLPGEVIWGERIRVPFAPETAASGVDRSEYLSRCWYRTTFAPPPSRGPLHIHFGAVNGDPAALALCDELSTYLARIMAWIVGLLRPHHVSLAGPIVNLGEEFLNQTVAKVEAMLWQKVTHPVAFSLAYSGNLSAIGAAALALHRELDIL